MPQQADEDFGNEDRLEYQSAAAGRMMRKKLDQAAGQASLREYLHSQLTTSRWMAKTAR